MITDLEEMVQQTSLENERLRIAHRDLVRTCERLASENERLEEKNQRIKELEQYIRALEAKPLANGDRVECAICGGYATLKGTQYYLDTQSKIKGLEEKVKWLKTEVETLRWYGNKDCTAMAEEALDKILTGELKKAEVIDD